MITDKLRDATQKALAALVLIGRAPDTVDHYRIAFLHISRIAARFLSTEIDAEEFLKRYSLARTAYLNATLAPRYLQQRHERELNLLLLAVQNPDAESVAQKFEQRCNSRMVSLSFHHDASLREFATFLKDQGFRPDTIRSYVSKTRVFLRYLNEIHPLTDLLGLRPQDIIDSLARYTKDRSLWVKKAIPAPKRYFGWLFAKGSISSDLTPFFRQQHVKWEPEVKYFTPEQVQMLLNALDLNKVEDIMLHAIVTLVHYTGMRRGDVARLKISSIDWKKRTIAFSQSKTGKFCIVSLHDEVATSLARYLLYARPHQAKEFVFCQGHYPFAPFSAQTLGARFQLLRERVFGQEDFRSYGLHALRRGLGTRLFKAGVAVPLVQEVLGHRGEGANWAYIQADIDRLRECCISVPKGGGYE